MSNKNASPKDVFMHILSIATLYFSVGAFIALVFALINVGFPDPLESYYNPGSTLRWSISLLVVLFPVFIWSNRKIHQDILEEPVKKDYRVRKWLTHLTLFLAGALVIGDLVVLINTFLGGELTVRFTLKALTILIVASGIFGYYRLEVKEKIEELSKKSKRNTWIISIIVACVVFAGFWVVGTPNQQRLIRFDSERVNDLSFTQSRIISYWQSKNTLPETLSDLESDLQFWTVPTDPKTGESYSYTVSSDLTFQLCATFETESEENKTSRYPVVSPRGFDYEKGWSHSVGENCFERTIDPDFYNDRSLKEIY